MQPLHDKDLDRLSREAAERFEVETGASGWDNLEKRLDIELPQKKKKRRFLFWLFFITATTAGALIGIMKNQPLTPLAKNSTGIGAKSESGTSTTPLAPSQAATDPKPVNSSQTPVASTTTTTVPVVGSSQPAPPAVRNTIPDNNNPTAVTKPGKTLPTKSVTSKTDKTKPALNYTSITPDHVGRSVKPGTYKSKRKRSKQQNAATSQHKQTDKQANNNIQEPDYQVSDNEPRVNTNKPDQTTTQQTTAAATDPVQKEEATALVATDSAKTPAAPIVKKEPGKKQDKNVKGLELGVMAGPDLSTVKFGPIYKTGYNFGVQAGYRFSNRWSVNTGVIYTKKFYQADSQDFHYKMPNNYRLRNVEGNCSMWEIPVNVRYDVSFNDKRRWFVNTGLSTYLMDKEDYNVYYYTWSNNIYDWPISSDSNSNYVFSILNLSAGMERSLGKHVSIQAEPYLKIPLKGLGMGNMRMTSYGVLFTLKYKPPFNSKRSDNRK